MATAIEYESINQFALKNQTSDIEPGLIIPYGLEKKYAQKSHMELYGIKTSFDDYIKRKDKVQEMPAADASPSLPWSRFNEVMSSQNWQPLDAWANVNIGRYNNPASSNYRPEVDSLLRIIPLLKNEQDRIDAYEKLNMIFMVDQPAIPLVYLPEQFYYFNDKIWKNWPTQKNPYAPPQIPGLGSGTNILWHIYSK